MFKTRDDDMWVWCVRCKRVSRAGEYRVVNGWSRCPYPDCDGDHGEELEDWATVAAAMGYPAAPERSTVYRW